MNELLAGETGWLVGFVIGLAAGIALTRWLWINGQKHKRRAKRLDSAGKPDGQ